MAKCIGSYFIKNGRVYRQKSVLPALIFLRPCLEIFMAKLHMDILWILLDRAADSAITQMKNVKLKFKSW